MESVGDCMAELQMFVSVEECLNQLKKSCLLGVNLIHSYGEWLFFNYFQNYWIYRLEIAQDDWSHIAWHVHIFYMFLEQAVHILWILFGAPNALSMRRSAGTPVLCRLIKSKPSRLKIFGYVVLITRALSHSCASLKPIQQMPSEKIDFEKSLFLGQTFILKEELQTSCWI